MEVEIEGVGLPTPGEHFGIHFDEGAAVLLGGVEGGLDDVHQPAIREAVIGGVLWDLHGISIAPRLLASGLEMTCEWGKT